MEKLTKTTEKQELQVFLSASDELRAEDYDSFNSNHDSFAIDNDLIKRLKQYSRHSSIKRYDEYYSGNPDDLESMRKYPKTLISYFRNYLITSFILAFFSHSFILLNYCMMKRVYLQKFTHVDNQIQTFYYLVSESPFVLIWIAGILSDSIPILGYR